MFAAPPRPKNGCPSPDDSVSDVDLDDVVAFEEARFADMEAHVMAEQPPRTYQEAIDDRQSAADRTLVCPHHQCKELMARFEQCGTKRSRSEHLERVHHLHGLPLLQHCRWLVHEALREHNCEDWGGGWEYRGRYPKQRHHTPAGTVARRAQSTHLDLDLRFLECRVSSSEERAVVLEALNERKLNEILALFEHEVSFYILATGESRLVAPDTPVAEALLLTYLLEPTLEREMRKALGRAAKRQGSSLFTTRVVSAAVKAVHHPQAPTEARDFALALLAEGDIDVVYDHPHKAHLFDAVPHIKSKPALVQLERVIARLEVRQHRLCAQHHPSHYA